MSYTVCSKTERQCFRLVGDETWKGWELDENGYAKIYSAYAVYVRYDEAAGEYVTEYVYEDGCRVIYCYYRCAYCGTFHQIDTCVEKTSLTPMKDGAALWTDDAWKTDDNTEGVFTFDIDRVEMAWIDLSGYKNITLDEGETYVLATIYYITDDWADMFDSVYSEENGNAIQSSNENDLSGWRGMYIVEVTTGEGEDAVTTYYLFGYAYEEGELYLYHLYMDD